MDAKYINSFLEAFVCTLNQLGIAEVQRGSMKKKNNFYVELEVSSVINLSGSVQGSIALSMPQDTAKKLASAMMQGIKADTVDEIVKSAIGELSSMIAGSAVTKAAALGITLQISTPLILLEPCDINTFETLAIDFETPLGKIEFDIGFS